MSCSVEVLPLSTSVVKYYAIDTLDTFPVNVTSKFILQGWSLYEVNIGVLIVVFDYMSNMFAKQNTEHLQLICLLEKYTCYYCVVSAAAAAAAVSWNFLHRFCCE